MSTSLADLLSTHSIEDLVSFITECRDDLSSIPNTELIHNKLSALIEMYDVYTIANMLLNKTFILDDLLYSTNEDVGIIIENPDNNFIIHKGKTYTGYIIHIPVSEFKPTLDASFVSVTKDTKTARLYTLQSYNDTVKPTHAITTQELYSSIVETSEFVYANAIEAILYRIKPTEYNAEYLPTLLNNIVDIFIKGKEYNNVYTYIKEHIHIHEDTIAILVNYDLLYLKTFVLGKKLLETTNILEKDYAIEIDKGLYLLVYDEVSNTIPLIDGFKLRCIDDVNT